MLGLCLKLLGLVSVLVQHRLHLPAIRPTLPRVLSLSLLFARALSFFLSRSASSSLPLLPSRPDPLSFAPPPFMTAPAGSREGGRQEHTRKRQMRMREKWREGSRAGHEGRGDTTSFRNRSSKCMRDAGQSQPTCLHPRACQRNTLRMLCIRIPRPHSCTPAIHFAPTFTGLSHGMACHTSVS